MSDGETPSSGGVFSNQEPKGALTVTFVRPDLLGYVFHLTWIFLLFYNSSASATVIGGSSLPDNLIYMPSIVALVVTLSVGCWRTHRFMGFANGLPMTVGAPLATSLGTVVYYLYSVVGFVPLALLGGALTGFGSALLAARWAAVFGNAPSRALISNFPLMLVCIAVIAITVVYVPNAVWVSLLVALPLLSGACLQYARRYQRNLGCRKAVRTEAYRRGTPKTYALLVGFVGVIGFCSSCLSASGSQDGGDGVYAILLNAVAALITLGYAVSYVFRNDRSQFVVSCAVPLLVLVLVSIPFVCLGAGGVAGVFGPVGSVAFELMFFVAVVLVAKHAGFSPARTFMVARISLAVFDLLGSYAGEAIVNALGASAGLQAASMLMLVVAELMLVGLVAVHFLAGARAPRWQEGLGRSVGEISDLEEGVRKGSANTGETSAARCADVAERYGLSKRELDVLVLLVEGKTSTAICEELSIAQGTVNYHMRNIYAKTGVHTRQELMLLVLDGRRSLETR